MTTTVAITGPRSLGPVTPRDLYDLFGRYLAPFAVGAHFHLGGAAGVDTYALIWLAERTDARLTVVVPRGVDDQPSAAREAILEYRGQARVTEIVELNSPRLDASAYHARNRWMVDRSGFVIGFPRGNDQDSGTWYTLNYAAGQEKPRLVVPL